jgi:Zn-dependent peptidase ImmA (M78 family)
LHKELYDEHKFKNVEEWKDFVLRFPEKEHSSFEWQAYEFAGLILVPAHHLERLFRHHVRQLKDLGIRSGNVVLHRAAELLAKDFIVSPEVIQRRLDREKYEKGVSG